MKNVAFLSIGNLFIAVHGKHSPSDAEFPTVLETFRRLDFSKVRMLVVTEGGGPTPLQRKEMNAVLRGREMPTAVVSDDIIIRGTVTALSWFNKKIRAFPTSALDAALEYLGLPEERFESIVREVKTLRAEIDRSKAKGATLSR